MDRAQSSVFLTAAFGVNDYFAKVLSEPKPYLRYLLLEREDKRTPLIRKNKLNRVAVGSHLEESAFTNWLNEEAIEEELVQEESLTGLNHHVKYVHTKYMLIDPLSDDPIVITGSANFSEASTRYNDENMLVIRGDRAVADIYLTEFMRMFQHFRFRSVAQKPTPGRVATDTGHLRPDDQWRRPFYQPGSPKTEERLYFA